MPPAPKSWYQSLTIWSSLGQILLGLVIVALAVASVVPADWAAFGLSQLALGIAAVQGRLKASQPILSPIQIHRVE